MVHPYDDSESSEDEVDWQDTRHDPYRAGEAATGSGATPSKHTTQHKNIMSNQISLLRVL